MALKFRRGASVDRTSITPEEGEILHVTDHASEDVAPVWIGDGSTAGGLAVGNNATGLVGELGIYAANGTRISGSGANLTWDTSLNRLLITGYSRVISSVGNGAELTTFDSYHSDTTSSSIFMRRARGTYSSRQSVVNNDYTGTIGFKAHDGTNFIVTSSIVSRVTGTVSTGILPSSMYFTITGNDGVKYSRIKIDNSGIVFIGPYGNGIVGTGQLVVWQTDSGFSNSTIISKTVFNDSSGSTLSFQKARGTNSTPTPVLVDDVLSTVRSQGWNGSIYKTAAEILGSVSAAPDAGNIPGKISFGVSNSSGTMIYPTSIDHTSKLAHTGPVEITGTVSVIGNPFKLAPLTSTQRDILSPTGGELIYNTTDSKIQGWQTEGWFNLDGTPLAP